MSNFYEKIERLQNQEIRTNILSWLTSSPNQQEIEEVVHLIDTNSELLQELFGSSLAFGTAGLRSLMGIGTNRMNVFTVRKATQGLAQVLKRKTPKHNLRVVVGYDTRHHSFLFAQETACVLAGNQIQTLLFKTPQPLGLVSFSIRLEQACAGVMITASHNPPAYNGYKVYMHTGGQVLPPFDQELTDEFQKVEEIYVSDLSNPLIHRIGEEHEEAFLEAIHSLQLFPDDNRRFGDMISLSYSSLHGAGVSLLPRALKKNSFSKVYWVEPQMIQDGDFPTISSPNPEDKESLSLGIQQMIDHQHDLFVATDPDVDRLGVVCLDEGDPYIFNGNQIACLLLDHIFDSWSQHRNIGPEFKVVKSIVTTEMLTTIARHYGASMINVNTGFKYIGEKIEQFRQSPEQGKFVFGAEESYGYLYGSLMEDKDAVSSSTLLVEKALQEKIKGKTLRDRMLELYDSYGYFMNHTQPISFQLDELNKIKIFLDQVEKMDLTHLVLGNEKVTAYENYMLGVGKLVYNDSTYALKIPKTRMICYHLEQGGRIIIRPSGTEPKIKLYFETIGFFACPAKNKDEMLAREKESQLRLATLMKDFQSIFF